MSSAKSRNFRRRAGDEDEDDTTTSSKANGTVSNTAKPKKPTTASQPRAKTLLSFADDELDEGEQVTFSRPSVAKPSSSLSSSRSSSQKSAHKLTSAKDRNAPKPSSSSLPSNVQPQSGMYTKEALLELQKNTKTLAARTKPKPAAEPMVVLKGLIKPVAVKGSDDGGMIQTWDIDGGDMGSDKKAEIEREEADLSKLKNVRLAEDSKGIPDQAAIEAARAKRERLRQVRAAAPDYIALDSGGNHGENEGLSDEEPEFRGRIGFFGEKIGVKRGVFEDFDAMTVSKEKDIAMVGEEDNDEEEEDKMWEEEQVRKGLGKRLDEGITNQGVSVSSSVNHASGLQPVYGYPNVGVNGAYTSVQNVNVGYGSVGGDMFSSDVISITQQAELAKKALHENMRRAKESLSRTDESLAKTEDNLLSSLANVTRLEYSLAAAGEKFIFMQKLQDYVSVICEFLRHKAPFIEELEDQMQNLHKERARAIAERRQADNEDELLEIEKATTAARAELCKGGDSAIKLATAAAKAALSDAKTLANAPMELDEFGRDLNLLKRMDIIRRAEARERKRSKADGKRRLAIENDASFQQMEGEMSTDESDSESTAYESTRNELLHVADKIFSDAEDEYSRFPVVIERFEKWKKEYASSYRDAYMSLSISSIFSPYVRLELLKWDPLHEDADFMDMKWHSLLFNYGLSEDENTVNGEDADDEDSNLIPRLVEKLAIPILQYQLESCWNVLSTRETRYAVTAMNLIIRYVDLSSSALAELIAILRDRLTKAVSDLTIPAWSPLEMKVVPNASRIAAYKFGTAVRLLRNLCLWDKILATPVLEKIVLDQLLYGKILPHLLSIQLNIHDAILRTERVIASLNGVWSGPGVTVDRSRKLLQPLVDYLLLLGKKLEKMQNANSLDTESGKLVRRLKKMLVELNEYDHGRAISKTFNLKEAL